MSTVIGFACAMGFDMGFNRKHHHAGDETTIQKISHHHDKSYHHGEDNDHHKSKDDKDNCCNDIVVKFAHVDKLLTQSSNFTVSPSFFPAFFPPFVNIDALPASQVTESIKYFVRNHHPPISDIRIEVQSFQI
jgi:hypothetical protein